MIPHVAAMPRKKFVAALMALALGGCHNFVADGSAPMTLKESARGLFHVGVAINSDQILEKDTAGVAVIEKNFDSITPENALKWEVIHPQPDRYDFVLADKYVEFGTRRGLWVIGHNLMWHSQTPDWVFRGENGQPVGREELLRRLRDHIHTVAGRYRGKVKGWDVVNEAIKDEDGTLRIEKPWYAILGDEGIFAAFAAAHEADPDAELYYNDYALSNPVKRAGVLKLAQAIRARGLRIDGIGTQYHCSFEWPKVEEVDAEVAAIGRAGFKVMITELDVTVLPRPKNYYGAEISTVYKNAPELDAYREGLPAAQQRRLAKRYGELFAVFAKHHDAITRVTLWGVSDRGSWLNNWPIKGRTDHALLFDREYRPKPAFGAVISVLQATSAR
jgi:endo-1,4-beta-xylanase